MVKAIKLINNVDTSLFNMLVHYGISFNPEVGPGGVSDGFV